MSRKLLASFLMFALVILVFQPRNIRAQSQPDRVMPENLRNSPAGKKPDLKEYFDSELRTMKTRQLTRADLVRIEKDSQTPKPKSDFSKKDKMFLALFIVLMTGLVIVLIKHPCKEKKPGDCEFVNDTTY
ncbi:MAG TPA: hypothetical protein VN643_27090 [Pyrinomonadaceae bacterium]|nr:hypothetical protein [Pyrinomonadaceae bacterium]